LQFRAQYSYALSAERGAFAHRNPRNFKNPDYFDSFLASYQKEFNRQLRNRNREISRAYEEYGDAPTWLAVEIMSFGTLSMLFKNTRSAKVRSS
ncbi:Abi family protein, partial [Klebsiella pneumoniae]|uniref:Abi family protein n=1 Tax=Klebsiella pneumoniae TaxID=573 RepID=UPI003013E465